MGVVVTVEFNKYGAGITHQSASQSNYDVANAQVIRYTSGYWAGEIKCFYDFYVNGSYWYTVTIPIQW
jgi:hypothetical protein